MKKEDLLCLAACWNAGHSYLIETDEQIEEIWQEIVKYGFHEIEQNTDLYEKACLQLYLDPKACYPIYQTNNYSCKFGGLEE